MSTPEPTIQLTDEQIAFYHREGYLAIDALTTREEVETLRELIDEMFASRTGHDDGDHHDLVGQDDEHPALPQICFPEKYHPQLKELLLRANANVMARQLLGAGATAAAGAMILKPARYGAETPWHQDIAYWDPALEHNALTIWIPLQEATIENGCMQFVPRSHTGELLPHRSMNDDPHIHALEIEPGAINHIKGVVPCPLPAGGATFHHFGTLHYAGPNRTDHPRRAYILDALTPPTRRDQPLEMPWQERWRTSRSEKLSKQ